MNLSKFYKNKKILITGVTGFKGSWLASWLLILGAKVYGIGYQPNQNKKLFYDLNLSKKINFNLVDVRNLRKFEKLVKKIKPSIIFHLAAQPLIYQSYKKPFLTFDININGTLNLMEIIRKNSFIKSAVIVTSDKCYESNNSTKGFKETDRLGGIDPYSASKASAELISRAYKKSFFENSKKRCGISTGRAGNVIGGGDWSLNRLIPDTIISLKRKKEIIIRNPNYNRPWQHVLEPLKGYLILALKQYVNPQKYASAWNFGTKPNTLTSVKKIVEYIISFWGSGSMKVKKNKLYEQVNLQLNIKKAQKILKWNPTYNIKESVKLTTQWYKEILIFKKSPEKVTHYQIRKYMNDSKIN
tara:strand:+ start:3803 stop:4873 length:1071 start_codon:yes stop_codon:yes gene_type:complete